MQAEDKRGRVAVPGWAVFTATAATVLVAVGGSAAAMPVNYTSNAVVALTPKATDPVSATVVTLAAPRYVAYGTSPYVLRQVAAPLGMDSVELQNGIVVTMAAATANISIAVTLEDPALAARAADAVAAAVLRRTESDPILDAQLLSSAVPAEIPSGPDRGAVLASGSAAAVLLGGAGWAGLARHRRRRASVVRGIAAVPATAQPDLTRELPIYRSR